jgi:hypothetical protein
MINRAEASLSLSLPQRGRVLLVLSLWERDWVRVRNATPHKTIAKSDAEMAEKKRSYRLTPAWSNVAISFNTLTAASIIPIARAAPVPSPRRMPRSRIGTAPRRSSIKT